MSEKMPLKSRLFEAMGIVVPAEWDPEGKPFAWVISTYDEKLYRIDTRTPNGLALCSFPGRKIRVYGYLNEGEDGNHQLTVQKYALLDDLETIR